MERISCSVFTQLPLVKTGRDAITAGQIVSDGWREKMKPPMGKSGHDGSKEESIIVEDLAPSAQIQRGARNPRQMRTSIPLYTRVSG